MVIPKLAKSHETLLPGLTYALKHALTQREMKVLLCLMEKPASMQQISSRTKINLKTLHTFIQSLKLKGIIALLDRDAKHNNIYEFNPNSL